MRPDTRFCVTAHISNGTTLTFYSDSIMAVGAWKEGVSGAAALFSESVQFVFEQNDAPRYSISY